MTTGEGSPEQLQSIFEEGDLMGSNVDPVGADQAETAAAQAAEEEKTSAAIAEIQGALDSYDWNDGRNADVQKVQRLGARPQP